MKKCYVYYSPNGGIWPDGTIDPKLSATPDGMMADGDKFYFPDGAFALKREGYRHQTSQRYLAVPRFYTADGKGGGFDPEKICNGFGYDCWPYNALELSEGGHDTNWLGLEGMPIEDGGTLMLYACWDPIVNYHIDGKVIRDFVYKTEGDEYTVLGKGEKTNYGLSRTSTNIDGYYGEGEIPSVEFDHWEDKDGNVFIPGKKYTITEPLELFAK